MQQFLDNKGNIINVGDVLILEIKALGKGEVDVIMMDNEPHINDDHSGAYPLRRAIERDDMILYRKEA